MELTVCNVCQLNQEVAPKQITCKSTEGVEPTKVGVCALEEGNPACLFCP